GAVRFHRALSGRRPDRGEREVTVTRLTSRPAASAQNAAPIPRKVSPEAATTNVRAATSRPSAAVRAPASADDSVASRASPATAPATSGGAAPKNTDSAAEK